MTTEVHLRGVEADSDHGTNLSRSERRAAAAEAERDRCTRLAKIGRKYAALGGEALAERAMAEGWTVDRLCDELVHREDALPAQRPVTLDSLGVHQREQKRFSLMRAIRFLTDPAKHQRDAGLEIEVSRAIEAETGKAARGLLIPGDVFAKRAYSNSTTMSVSSDVGGGFLVGTDHLAGEFIDAIRQSSVILNRGVRVLDGLRGDVFIPKLTAGSQTYWLAEGEDVAESSPTFGGLSMSPHTLGATVDLTRRLILQSSPGVEDLVRRDFIKAFGEAIDAAILDGAGTGAEPAGILSHSALKSVSSVGAPDLADVVGRIAAIGDSLAGDEPAEGLAWLLNWSGWAYFAKTLAFADTDKTLWADGKLWGTPAAITKAVPANTAVVGNFSNLILGMWSGVDLIRDESTLAQSGGVRLVALQDVDVAVRYGEAFGALLDCTFT